MSTPTNLDDTIDSRDIIARFEELESDLDDLKRAVEDAEEALVDAQSDLKGAAEDLTAAVDDLEVEQAEKDIQDLNGKIEDLEAALKLAEGELQDWDDRDEYEALEKLIAEASTCADWQHGAQLIRETYFVDYIEELIDDCYDLPKELTSGEWPYRHITVDYEAAAEEVKSDYTEVDFDGVTYLVRY